LESRLLDFVAAAAPAGRVLLEASFRATAGPEALLEFFRVFWDMRLPFVAFSGASWELGERAATSHRLFCRWANLTCPGYGDKRISSLKTAGQNDRQAAIFILAGRQTIEPPLTTDASMSGGSQADYQH
jgi:hypothetical protein